MIFKGEFTQWGGWILATILVMLYFPLLAQEEQTQSALREEAIESYKIWMKHKQTKDLQKAIKKFNEFLLSNPSDEQILKLRRQADQDMLLHMLTQGGEVAKIARTILMYAEKRTSPYREEESQELSRIKELVKKLMTGNLYERNEAMAILQTIGEPVIPVLLPFLTKKDEDQNVYAILAINKIDRLATIPLIESLRSKELELRQQVCILLGHIGDIRALADLQRIVEDKEEKEEVKEHARKAIRKITSKSPIALGKAKELYHKKALAYYLDAPEYKPKFGARNTLFWKWENDRLVSQRVASFVYNEIMAQHACYNALELDANLKSTWALLARAYYSEFVKIETLEQFYKDKEPPKDVTEELKLAKQYVQKTKKIVNSCSSEILYEALQCALNENHPEIAIAILDDIGEISKGKGDTPASVLKALRSNEKRVQFAAAEALVKINPTSSFTDSQKVVEILADFLTQSDFHAVLVIDDNDASRNEMLAILRNLGLYTIGSSQVREGIQRARMVLPHLIILSTELETVDVSFQYILSALAEETRTKDIPIILVCPKTKLIERGLSVPNLPKGIVAVIERETASPMFVKTLVEEKVMAILPKEEPAKGDEPKETSEDEGVAKKEDVQLSKKEQISLRAMQALESIPSDSKIFSVKNACNSIRPFITQSKRKLRTSAIRVVGKVGDIGAIKDLEKVLENEKENLEIRIEAALALGQIFNKTKVEVKREEFEIFTNTLQKLEQAIAKETSMESKRKMEKLEKQIFYLLGQANLRPEERREFFIKYRVHDLIKSSTEEEPSPASSDSDDTNESSHD